MNLCALPVDDRAWYLAGPMTGIPQFNFPAFEEAANELQNRFGLCVISPVELDAGEVGDAARMSPDGELVGGQVGGQTQGDLLARAVKTITDVCCGIIFLAGWEQSRGARLEAFVGILAGYHFARYAPGSGIEYMSPQTVLTMLVRETHKGIHSATN